jgi:UDP-4-amino-4-deoxy-L-arabinose formyltransferase/UDP-glucuronic acid dehydrogenase (UDP-4-keto-hexauronic acid decarboxylating)
MPSVSNEAGRLLNVLLVGEESAGAQTLKLLARSGHRVVGVLAKPQHPVWQLAQNMGYRTWPAAAVKEASFADVIRVEQVDLLLNVHSLFIIAPAIVQAPRYGSFNLHPGSLPQYAGLNTVSWALYRGAHEYGVTLHKMDAGIDTGPVVFQTHFPVSEDDTALTVYITSIRAGVSLIQRLLDSDPARLPLAPQDLTQREYFGKHIPADGCVRWERPARELYNLVRACDYFPFASPWGSPRATLNGQAVKLIKAQRTGQVCNAIPGTVRRTEDGGVEVACADEWLQCDRIILNGRAIKAAAVLQPAGDSPASVSPGI